LNITRNPDTEKAPGVRVFDNGKYGYSQMVCSREEYFSVTRGAFLFNTRKQTEGACEYLNEE
jgi:hypothetical protein